MSRPAYRDSSVLAYTAAHDLVLITRNVRDFIRLNEQWVALRDWGVLARPHAGILISLGVVPEREWADLVMDLVLHPQCPPLQDQLLLWHAVANRWETDNPYSHQRRRAITL